MVKQVGGKRTSRRGDPEAAPFHISARTWGAGERRVRFGQRIYCLSLNPKEGEVITRCRVIRTETSWMEIGTTGELPGLTAVLWCANLGTWCCIFTTYLQTLCVATHKFYPLVAYLWGWVVIHLITPAPYGFTKLPDNHGSCRETSKARKTQIKRGHTTHTWDPFLAFFRGHFYASVCVYAWHKPVPRVVFFLPTSVFVGCQWQVLIPSGVSEPWERLALVPGGVCVWRAPAAAIVTPAIE